MAINNYHLLTETEGNSVFCGPETVDVSRGEAEGNSVFCGPETVDVSRGEAEGNIDG